MSIHFISGKPGGGKTLYSVKLIVDELVHGKRIVITNVPLRLGELNKYLQEAYPAVEVDVLNRVMMLEDDDVGRFWLIRPGWYRIADVDSQAEKRGVRLDWSKCFPPGVSPVPVEKLSPGSTESDFYGASAVLGGGVKTAHELGAVLYVIDEIHNFFNAREWMNTGKSALFYLSQHRKLGDDVICITQSIGNVDKQFRSVSQDFTYLRNHAKERYGCFRSFSAFTRRTYSQPATGAPGEKPMESGYFRLDVSGLAGCYDTASGVGIHGRAADVGAKARGLPLWLLGLVVLCGAACLAMMPRGVAYGMRATQKSMTGGDLVGGTNVSTATPQGASPGAAAAQLPERTTAQQPIGTSAATADSKSNEKDQHSKLSGREVECVGIVAHHTLGRVYFSDGSCIAVGNPRLQFLSKDVVIVDGKRFELRMGTSEFSEGVATDRFGNYRK